MIAKKLTEKGIRMLDAPMTGSTPQAETGTLNFMVGGDKKNYDEVQEIFQAMGANIFHVGGHGAGHSVKLMNNFLGQLNGSAIAEMLLFGHKYGVDLKAFYDVVSVSGGNSTMFQGMVPKVLERDFTVNFMLKLVHKDLRYITELGRATGSPMPVANSIFNIFDMAKAAGLGDENFSAIMKFYEKITGEEVKPKAK
jgi:3-hydroxyisobutyrate dehydrogenase-like beta-hydroxyacid dehydrogenase